MALFVPAGSATAYADLPVVALETEAGDCTVHFGHCLHAAPPPAGKQGRRTIYVGFTRPGIEKIFAPGEGSNDVLYTSEDAFIPNADEIGKAASAWGNWRLTPSSHSFMGEGGGEGVRKCKRALQRPAQRHPALAVTAMRSAATDAERKLWEKLRREGFGVKFKRQYAVRGYIVDFCCPQRKLIIGEPDGGQHMESSAYNERRTRILAQDRFRVLRFWNSDVVENLDGVLESIMQALRQEQAPSPPALSHK